MKTPRTRKIVTLRLADEARKLQRAYTKHFLVRDCEAWRAFCFRHSTEIVFALQALAKSKKRYPR